MQFWALLGAATSDAMHPLRSRIGSKWVTCKCAYEAALTNNVTQKKKIACTALNLHYWKYQTMNSVL
jgi:hypothetical protein